MNPIHNQEHALYRFFDAADVLLYVGLTVRLPTRLRDHHRGKAWWDEVARMTVQRYPSRPEVVEAERLAITTEHPKYNVQHNGGIRGAIEDRSNIPFGPRWIFENHRSGNTWNTPLHLWWEVDSSPYSDNFLVEEIEAPEMWQEWLRHYPRDESAEAVYGEGAFMIYWYVGGGGTFESVPFQDVRGKYHRSDFLKHYTWPVSAETGERVQWARLPVVDKVWRADHLPDPCDFKGGFIQEATGWKASPLQPFVNIYQLGRISGLHVSRPERRDAQRPAAFGDELTRELIEAFRKGAPKS